MMTRLGAVVLVMAGLTCVCNPVQGVTVTNNPTADAMLRESEGPNNFGVTPWLCVKGAENNGHVALARFSLSAHADDFARPGFKLTKATLRFMVWDDGVAGAYTCSIDALHEDNDDWVEGTSDWPVESGAACWDYRAHNTDAWAGGASGALAAVDRRTDWGAIGQFTVQPLGGGVGQICEAEIAEVFDDGTTREDLFRSWAGLAGAYGTDGVNPGFVIHNTRNGSTYVLSREETALSGSLPELVFEYTSPPLGTGLVYPTADTRMSESAPVHNFGADTWLTVKTAATTETIAMKYNLGGYADEFTKNGFKLTKATLRFQVYDDWGSGDYTCPIDALHEDNNGWIEGTSDNAVESGAPCWNYRAHNTVSWAGGASGALAAADRRTDWGPIAQMPVITQQPGSQTCEAEIAEVFSDGTTREDLFRSWAGLAGAYGTAGVNPGFVIHNPRNGSTYVLSREETAQSGSLPELAFEYSFPKGTVVAVR